MKLIILTSLLFAVFEIVKADLLSSISDKKEILQVKESPDEFYVNINNGGTLITFPDSSDIFNIELKSYDKPNLGLAKDPVISPIIYI